MRLSLLTAGMLLLGVNALGQTMPAPQPPVKSTQKITVTADRGLIGIDDSASSIAVLPQEQLQAAPGFALDDRLHQVAGFFLFRRTSSWTANPTTQGLSLRGLGSTAASRTLVVSDQVPQNDAFLNSIHWNEIPALAIEQVELVRGGSAELYGSSAIGGVVDVVPVRPARPLVVRAQGFGANENTGLGDALVAGEHGRFGGLGALSVLSTGGYITTAPAARGLIDVPSNVVSESARVELTTTLARTKAFLRGNLLNEARQNGTVLQTNGTRLWRYQAGDDAEGALGHAALRLYGAREAYRQSFTSTGAGRNSEALTNLQHVPTDEFGVVLQGSHGFRHAVTAALGVDLRDVRSNDVEQKIATGIVTSIAGRQRETGGYADAIWQPRHWSVSGSVRVDSFRTFDGRQVVSNSASVTAQPVIAELVASPRVGLVRQLPGGVALTATAFRAFRGPTLNELYRTGQVGAQTTLANNMLLAERATGFEFGGELVRSRLGHLRATYFWTEVNRPISSLVTAQTGTAQTLLRVNLGQIRSRGVMFEAQTETHRGFDAGVSYQFALATVTKYNAANPVLNPNITGNWIPQVPRQAATATANYRVARLADFHVIASYTGQQFDDAANQFLLHAFARFDVSAERRLGRGFSLYAGAQNLLDRTIEAGRTPSLTLASPRVVQAGVRFALQR